MSLFAEDFEIWYQNRIKAEVAERFAAAAADPLRGEEDVGSDERQRIFEAMTRPEAAIKAHRVDPETTEIIMDALADAVEETNAQRAREVNVHVPELHVNVASLSPELTGPLLDQALRALQVVAAIKVMTEEVEGGSLHEHEFYNRVRSLVIQ